MQLTLNTGQFNYNHYFVSACSATGLVEGESEKKKYNDKLNIFDRIGLHFIVKKLAKKFKSINQEIQADITSFETTDISNTKTFDFLVEKHQSIVKILDKFCAFDELVNSNSFSEPTKELHSELVDFFDLLKKFELKLRVKLFPDRNEVVFTYDELQELKNAFKGLELEDC